MASPRSTVVRRTAGLSLAAASAFLASGCVSITASSSSQLDVVGDAQVVLDLCQDELWQGGPTGRVPISPGCPTTEYSSSGLDAQVFLTFLVPSGAGAPEQLTVSDGVTGQFVPSPSDTEALTYGQAAPDGYRWVSYRSTPVAPLAVGADAPRSGKVTAKFDVRTLAGTFDYGVMAAFRWASSAGDPGDFAPDRPVSCGSTGNYDMTDGQVPMPGTACVDSFAPQGFMPPESAGRISPPAPPGPSTPLPSPGPSPAPSPEPSPDPTPEPSPEPTPTTTPAPGTVRAGGYTLTSIPLSRLTVTAPAATSATAGTPARITFSQTSTLAAGATESSVALAGSTTIPGATVSTEPSLTIGSSDAIVADVTIPASTAPGEYPVTITAGARTGRRTATATLKVAAAPPVATPAPGVPTPTPAPKTVPEQLADTAETLQDIVQRAKKVSQLRKGAMTVPVVAPAAGTVRVSIVGRKKIRGRFPTIAVGSEETKVAGKVDVTVKRTPYGRELLRSGEPVEATLIVRLFSKSGKTVTTGLPITLD